MSAPPLNCGIVLRAKACSQRSACRMDYTNNSTSWNVKPEVSEPRRRCKVGPTWAGCTGIRVSRSSQSGLPHSSIPMYELPTGRCARIISCHLSRSRRPATWGTLCPLSLAIFIGGRGIHFTKPARGPRGLPPPTRAVSGGPSRRRRRQRSNPKEGGSEDTGPSGRKVLESERGQGAGTIYNRRTSCLRLPCGLLALEAQRENSARAREGGR
ncbi:hypothetical protein BC826DRAFT_1044894 [Russula brevipes]|nr:hypothetical protein BC826DRAFT_1044894 [Russula brevipes]